MLRLANTRITGAGLQHLEGMPQLRSLSFFNTSITDAGLMHLGKMKSLRDVYLNGTQITDAGLPYLYTLTDLEAIDLGSVTGITPEGVSALQKALPDCIIFHRLSQPSQSDVPMLGTSTAVAGESAERGGR